MSHNQSSRQNVYTQRGGSSTGYKVNRVDLKSFNKDIFLVSEKESISIPNTAQPLKTKIERSTENRNKSKVILNLANLKGTQNQNPGFLHTPSQSIALFDSYNQSTL